MSNLTRFTVYEATGTLWSTGVEEVHVYSFEPIGEFMAVLPNGNKVTTVRKHMGSYRVQANRPCHFSDSNGRTRLLFFEGEEVGFNAYDVMQALRSGDPRFHVTRSDTANL
jgi:hypothetical protein